MNQTWLINCLRRKWLPAVLLGNLAAVLVGLLLPALFPASSQIVAYLQLETEQAKHFGEGGQDSEKVKSSAERSLRY